MLHLNLYVCPRTYEYFVDCLQVQKTVLHALVSTVHNSRRRVAVADNVFDVSDSVISFNSIPGSAASSTLQMHLLRLVLSVIGLEHQLIASKIDSLLVCFVLRCV